MSITFGEQMVLHNVSLQLKSNEVLGLVGESGSGKTLTALAVLGLCGPAAKIKGSVYFEGRQLIGLAEKEMRRIRGSQISIVFQEPMSALNPTMRCGKQVREAVQQHQRLESKEAKLRVIETFERVQLKDPARIFNSYPHELSGGQKQRVLIAMAIINNPRLLIADEPTTALDVSVSTEILALIKALQQETQMSVLFITHDLKLLSKIADRVAVMYQGKLLELQTVQQLFENPQHLYTKALLNARPPVHGRLKKLPSISDFENPDFKKELVSSTQRKAKHKKLYAKEPLLEIKNLSKTFITKVSFFGKEEIFKAVDDVSLKLYAGETLGLVGESGSGKSTLAAAILLLNRAGSGNIFYRGKDITALNGQALRALRKEIQIVFQDPWASLNPRLTVGKMISEPMKVHGIAGNYIARKARVLDLLEEVGLEPSFFNRYPHEFSGGQRQRINIARALATEPKLLVCDESVSALDISIQAQVLNLLNELKTSYGLTYIFISHDLAVVKHMADALLVMRNGKIVEAGEADSLFSNPKSNYTRKLLRSIYA